LTDRRAIAYSYLYDVKIIIRSAAVAARSSGAARSRFSALRAFGFHANSDRRLRIIEEAAMQVVLGFAPFIAFALLTRLTGVGASLCVAAAVAAALAARNAFAGRAIKILEAGTVVLFGLLAAYTTLTQSDWSLPLTRAVADGGLLAIVLLSIVIRQPFTLQYAREQVPPEIQSSPLFLRVNIVISAVWALAFAVGLIADLAMEYAPGAPLWLDVAAIVAALVGAIWFTQWYPAQVRRAALAASRG
jgi:hypothetical protein